MPNPVRRELITAAIEGTYGVDATPAGSDAILVSGVIEYNPAEDAVMHERQVVDGSMGDVASIHGSALGGLTLKVEARGSGTAGAPPDWGVLMRACGFEEVIVADTSVAYTPVSEGHESCTIYYYQGGVLHALTGARGSVSFEGTSKLPGMLTFTMKGHKATPIAQALVTPTYQLNVPPAIVGAPVTYGGVAASIGAFTFDLAAEIPARPVFSGDGFADLEIINFMPTATINPETVALATYDFLAQWRNSAPQALSIGPVGGTAGNRWSFSAPQAQIITPSYEDADGIRRLALELKLCKQNGDDTFTLTLS